MADRKKNQMEDDAVELDEAELKKARGGFTPNTGADKMEFASRDDPRAVSDDIPRKLPG